MARTWTIGLALAASVGAACLVPLISLTPVAQACGGYGGNPTTLLRDMGPDGLKALLSRYDESHDQTMLAQIDAVAGQKDAVTSRLYWYTDMAKALSAAKAQGKPMLHLRLLGKLTDEYSCANSRFFRTVLYANPDVANLLRERFVLVWTSERPVPVVTIDFGDGRLLKRTITGNSVHYVMDGDGRVIDALPGLYDPVTFSRIVRAAGEVASAAPTEAKSLYAYDALSELDRAWAAQFASNANPIQTLARTEPATQTAAQVAGGTQRPAPNAAEAAPRAMGKGMAERPVLRVLSPEFAAALTLSPRTDDPEMWQTIVQAHLGDARLHPQVPRCCADRI